MEEKILKNPICIVDEKYVYPNQTKYSLKRQKIFSFKNKFTVKDECKNKYIYVCELNQFNQHSSIKNMEDNNIVRFDGSFSPGHKSIVLYSGNSNTGKNINIKHHIGFSSSYTFEIYNKITNRSEEFEVFCSSFSSEIKVYYGKKKEGGILICKAEKVKLAIPIHFKAVIESNVDTIFALTIIFYFIKLLQKNAAAASSAAA